VKGVTPDQSAQREIDPLEQSILLKSSFGILRTGGVKTTHRGKKW